MSLDSDDELPNGISLSDAYAAIRAWYQSNVDRFAADPDRGRYPQASKPYITSMPSPENATREQMVDAFRRVIAAALEGGYHKSDGRYKMAAYAIAASNAAGIDPLRPGARDS
jgi:hypothetical protein